VRRSATRALFPHYAEISTLFSALIDDSGREREGHYPTYHHHAFDVDDRHDEHHLPSEDLEAEIHRRRVLVGAAAAVSEGQTVAPPEVPTTESPLAELEQSFHGLLRTAAENAAKASSSSSSST